jgi:hypothetical protein
MQLFLVEGVITVGLAGLFALVLPNSNKKILLLSPLECEWVQWNMAKDQGQEDNRSEISAWKGFMLALTDVKMWMLMGILYCVSRLSRVFLFYCTSH